MIEYLGKTVTVSIDRKLGSKHPNFDLIYPVNYGYLQNTLAGDNEAIDAYVLGVFEPVEAYEGIVIGVIKRNNDVEDKLVVASTINQYDKLQIKALTEFQERFFDSEIITFDYLRSSIRNTVRALISNDDYLLVLEEVYKDKTYFFLPGGGVEFREESEHAIRREVREELDAEVIECIPFVTLSNIFEIEGVHAHEITQVYKIVVDKDVRGLDGQMLYGDTVPCKARWIRIDSLLDASIDFYPESLIKHLTKDR